jgi:hypothetical protein
VSGNPTAARENTMRGVGITARCAKKTTCPRGHPYSYVDTQGDRRCETCDRKRWASRDRRKKTEAAHV